MLLRESAVWAREAGLGAFSTECFVSTSKQTTDSTPEYVYDFELMRVEQGEVSLL